jgi:hypothetical protein
LAGWIKLHRKILDSTIFDNADLLKVWIWCLLKATHDDYTQLVGLQVVELTKGQFITGRFKGAEELKLNPSTFYKYLKVLEKLNMIDLNSNNKMTIVTIVNWGKYQLDENETCQQNNNNVTTKEQQSNTNKNIKNNKNINNNIYSVFDSYSENSDLRQALRDYSQMRNKIKAPLTERAVTLLLNKLDALASTDDLKIKLLEQAIMSNWKSVYPLKEEKQQKPITNKFHNFIQHEYTDGELEAIAQKRFENKIKSIQEGRK